MEQYSNRMSSRDETSYSANPTCTLNTALSYWSGRLPYNEAHNIPSQLPRFMIELLLQAAGGSGTPHGGADLSRLQEVVRYGAEIVPDDEEPPSKRSRNA